MYILKHTFRRCNILASASRAKINNAITSSARDFGITHDVGFAKRAPSDDGEIWIIYFLNGACFVYVAG